MKSHFCVVGATGNVGRNALRKLLLSGIDPARVSVVASASSVGKTLTVEGYTWTLQGFAEKVWRDQEICLLATDEDVSTQCVPYLLEHTTCFVLDSSSAYRMEHGVPLMVGPLNGHQVTLSHRLYAHANCVAVPVSLVLAPLRPLGLRRVHVSTYQSAAGAGQRTMEQLKQQTKTFLEGASPQVLSASSSQMAFNVRPMIGRILPEGYTSEEHKIVQEVQKILGYRMSLFATSVRVPTLQGHGASVWIEVQKDVSLASFLQLLEEGRGLSLRREEPPTAVDALGQEDVLVGRIYKAAPYHFHVWTCSDNLLRGASTDLVETALGVAELVDKHGQA